VKAGQLSFVGWLTLLGACLSLALVISLGVGAVQVPVEQVLSALFGRPDRALRAADLTIIWDLRLPRAVLAALVGAGLAGAGGAFQSMFRNPLADPFVIGASGGAALGATLAIVLAGNGPLRGVSTSLAAFVGALGAVFLVYLLAASSGETISALLLAGATLSTSLSAVVSLLMLLNDQKLQEIFAWLMGSFSGRSWPQLWASGPLILIGLGLLWLLARPLDALATGDDSARSLGLPLEQARVAIVCAASLVTAAAVASCGIIGFVGLIAPHIGRLLVGTGYRRLLPISALIGALMLLATDSLARSLMPPLELPVGIFTALIGGPSFLWLLRRRQQ